jgi:type III restriction enzyme
VRHFRTTADGGVTGEIERAAPPVRVLRPCRPPQEGICPTHARRVRAANAQQPNEIVNEIRQAVGRWRQSRATRCHERSPATSSLLARDDRERRLFFCQIEAAETIIYLTEAAEKRGDTSALNVIREANLDLNDGLPRLAVKMATGSGQDRRHGDADRVAGAQQARQPAGPPFANTFLVVTPGITIRDRLRVLLPNDPGNFYRALDLVTPEKLERLQSATIVITNFHAFIRRETIEAASLTKKVLAGQATAMPSGSRRRRRRWSAESAAPSATRRHRRPQRRGPPLLRIRAP